MSVVYLMKTPGLATEKGALTLVGLERHAWTTVMGVTIPYNLSLSDVPMSVFVELVCSALVWLQKTSRSEIK